ncbi:type VI secretion system protein ImpA [Formivibrio citricus]|uniref:Type VI secretion system protein ImpA n=1 Tax=Formivibrio citricus TaxID=83765 RepID=A0A1I4WQT7_9NEIS|nr:type VI secretion system protein TssA [Formivibrio citricus]SFN16148.1 type VI secretion system protein ImpA [Formivibrio citricus]
MQNTSNKLAALLAPVSMDRPAGSDLTYSTLFDQIREARRADDPSLAQGEWEQALKAAEWPKVAQLCEEALCTQSKDLQLAGWYTEAMTHTQGFSGASLGLRLVVNLLVQYWESLYPELDSSSLDERIGKLEWLNTQLSFALRTVALIDPELGGYGWNDWHQSREVENIGIRNPDARAAAIAEGKLSGEVFDKAVQASGADWFAGLAQEVDELQAAYIELEEIANARFGDEAPSLYELRDTIRVIQETVRRFLSQHGLSETPAPKVSPVQVVIEKAKAMVNRIATPAHIQERTGCSVTQQTGVIANRDDAIFMLNEVARYFRTNEPHSPVAPLAERAAHWARMSLEDWLAHVVKDESTLQQLNDLLGTKKQL